MGLVGIRREDERMWLQATHHLGDATKGRGPEWLRCSVPSGPGLAKAAPCLTVCLPSKQPLFPPYLCELIKISSPNCSLALFSVSSPSFSLFNPSFSSHPTSHSFGITSYFLFHFLLQKMFLAPVPKIFGVEPYPCRYEFPLGTFPEVFHRPGAFTPSQGWFCQPCSPRSRVPDNLHSR